MFVTNIQAHFFCIIIYTFDKHHKILLSFTCHFPTEALHPYAINQHNAPRDSGRCFGVALSACVGVVHGATPPVIPECMTSGGVSALEGKYILQHLCSALKERGNPRCK